MFDINSIHSPDISIPTKCVVWDFPWKIAIIRRLHWNIDIRNGSSAIENLFIQFLSTSSEDPFASAKTQKSKSNKYRAERRKIHCGNWKYGRTLPYLPYVELISLRSDSFFFRRGKHMLCRRFDESYEWWRELGFSSLHLKPHLIELIVASKYLSTKPGTSQSETPNGTYEQTFSHHFSFNYLTPHRYK